MKKHHIAAITVGIILSIVTFIPVIVTMQGGYNLAHPAVIGVFLYPTIGVAVAAVIVLVSFLKGDK